ncbi:MAG TPA: hypothetical protein VN522_06265 [Solirubrobacterales bacterium]|nr:hypothetical protein [Solirubrobacterales bacterium]
MIDREAIPRTLWAYVGCAVVNLGLWIATVILLAGGLLLDVALGTVIWWASVLAVIQIVLLLSPTTRRFFGREATA